MVRGGVYGKFDIFLCLFGHRSPPSSFSLHMHARCVVCSTLRPCSLGC